MKAKARMWTKQKRKRKGHKAALIGAKRVVISSSLQLITFY